jgi:Holliday junction resolvase RusA-like endonuclease
MRHIYCLPWPPSANESHVHRTARVKNGPKAGKLYTARMLSKESIAYRQAVAIAVRAGHRAPPKLDGRLSISVLCCAPESFGRRAFDLDNRFKQLMDALQAAGVFLNDSQFDHEEMFRGSPFGAGKMLVAITDFEPDKALAELETIGLGPLERTLFDEPRPF